MKRCNSKGTDEGRTFAECGRWRSVLIGPSFVYVFLKFLPEAYRQWIFWPSVSLLHSAGVVFWPGRSRRDYK